MLSFIALGYDFYVKFRCVMLCQQFCKVIQSNIVLCYIKSSQVIVYVTLSFCMKLYNINFALSFFVALVYATIRILFWVRLGYVKLCYVTLSNVKSY